MKRLKRIVLLWLLPLVFAAHATAQSTLVGKIMGNGEGIPLANVVLYHNDTIAVAGCTSDVGGMFQIKKITPGTYTLKISYIGFLTQDIKIVCDRRYVDLGEISLQEERQNLNEVVVHAASLRRPDRLFVYPSAKQLKFSTNGIDLLMNLQLHRLWVDPVQRKVEALNGGKVGFLVNGKPAGQVEVEALYPGDILRVEYIDRPGLRYKDYAAVINYVTKAKESGGLLAAQAEYMAGFHAGNALLMGKYNRKRSEIGFHYNAARNTNATNDYYKSERYAFSPDSILAYEWREIDMDYKNQTNQGQLYYSNREENKYYFNAALRLSHIGQPYNKQRFQWSTPEGNSIGEKEERIRQMHYSPSLELYYDRHLPRKQFLAFNAVGTYMTNTFRYVFANSLDSVLLSQGGTRRRTQRHSWIGEGYYEKRWEQTGLSAGIRNTWSRTDICYHQPSDMQVTQKQNLAEAWMEISHSCGKWNNQFSAGIYSQRFEENDRARWDWSYKFILDLNYRIDGQSSINLQGRADRLYPGLSETNGALTQDDALLWSRGEVDLKPYTCMQSSLSYSLQKPAFSVEAYGYYRHFFCPVMDEVVYENGKFIQTYGNQKALQECQIILSGRIKLWKDYIALQLNPIFRHYVSRGNNYLHRSTSWSYTGGLMCSYKNWQLVFQMRNTWEDLWGEQLGFAQVYDALMLAYRYKQWYFQVGVNELLGRDYSHNKVERLSALYHSYEQYAHPDKIVSLRVSFTMPFGKVKQNKKQRLNNQDTNEGVLQETIL